MTTVNTVINIDYEQTKYVHVCIKKTLCVLYMLSKQNDLKMLQWFSIDSVVHIISLYLICFNLKMSIETTSGFHN